MRVTSAFYDRDGFLDAAPEATWPDGPGLFLDELDDLGSFSINVQADDPDLEDITDGSIIQFQLDGDDIWRGVLRRRTIRQVAADGAGRYTTLIGVGEVDRLDEMVVYPSGGLGKFPFSDVRNMDWTAPEFDDTGWDPAVVTPANYGQPDENFGLPEGMPDGDAEWIGAEDSSGSVDAGTWHLRGAGEAPSTRVRELWGAADDTFEAWLQGISSLKSGDTAYVGRTYAVELLVSEGPVQGAIRFTNLNNLKADALLSLLTPLDDTEDPVLHTDATWLVRPDGAPLGMNGGEILVNLFAEATARGEDPPAITFSATVDSNGDPWTIFEELSVPVGSTYLDVLRQMIDLEMCEFRMSPDAYELNLYNPGGAGDEVAYTLGDTNLTSLTFETAPALTTALLVRWGRGYTDVEDAGQVAAHGRRVAMLALGGVPSASVAVAQGGQVISELGEDRTKVLAGIDPESTGVEPYPHYPPGCSITSPLPGGSTSLQRVKAIALGMDAAGALTWEVRLNSALEEAGKRQQLMLKRLASGMVGGRTNASSTPYQPRPIQPRAPEPVKWCWPGPLIELVGGPNTFERAIRVRELRADLLTGSSSGDITIVLKKNGTTVATLIVAEGELQGYVPVAGVVFSQRPADVMTVEVTDAGTDAATLTVHVVYA